MTTIKAPASAGDSTLAPVDPALAPPIRMIDPRVPVWRRVETSDDVQAEAGTKIWTKLMRWFGTRREWRST